MKTVFYSTTSEKFNDGSVSKIIPSRAEQWDEVLAKYPDDEFVLITRRPANFLVDMKEGKPEKEAERIRYRFIPEDYEIDDVVAMIEEENPDHVVAIPLASNPYDWNFLKDSIIAEKLNEKGISTEANSVFTSIAYFDKWRSQLAFRSLHVHSIPGVYINNKLFWAENEEPTIYKNVYKEYILDRVKRLKYPVIIKGTVTSGSTGIQTAPDFEKAKEIILSESNDSDLIVEELVQGKQFGTEIHGSKGKWSVLPPLVFSTSEEGITNPFNNVKFGPVSKEEYHLEEVQEELKKLAERFGFTGTVQVDLVFDGENWYLIEVNPRWSGMTQTTTVMEDRSPFEIYTDLVYNDDSTDYSKLENLKPVLNFKIPFVKNEILEELGKREHVKFLMKQGNEEKGLGLAEVVLGGFDDPNDLLVEMNEIDTAFPGLISAQTKENARKLIESEG